MLRRFFAALRMTRGCAQNDTRCEIPMHFGVVYSHNARHLQKPRPCVVALTLATIVVCIRFSVVVHFIIRRLSWALKDQERVGESRGAKSVACVRRFATARSSLKVAFESRSLRGSAFSSLESTFIPRLRSATAALALLLHCNSPLRSRNPAIHFWHGTDCGQGGTIQIQGGTR